MGITYPCQNKKLGNFFNHIRIHRIPGAYLDIKKLWNKND